MAHVCISHVSALHYKFIEGAGTGADQLNCTYSTFCTLLSMLKYFFLFSKQTLRLLNSCFSLSVARMTVLSSTCIWCTLATSCLSWSSLCSAMQSLRGDPAKYDKPTPTSALRRYNRNQQCFMTWTGSFSKASADQWSVADTNQSRLWFSSHCFLLFWHTNSSLLKRTSTYYCLR